jgi:restriction endonuclease Mrr
MSRRPQEPVKPNFVEPLQSFGGIHKITNTCITLIVPIILSLFVTKWAIFALILMVYRNDFVIKSIRHFFYKFYFMNTKTYRTYSKKMSDFEAEEWIYSRAQLKLREESERRRRLRHQEELEERAQQQEVERKEKARQQKLRTQEKQKIERMKFRETIRNEKSWRVFCEAVDPYEFEKLVIRCLSLEGYGALQTPLSGDDGVDGYFFVNDQKIGIQVKRTKSAVTGPTMRDFIGALKITRCVGGIFVTTSKFTDPATNYANENHVTLFSSDETRDLFVKHAIDMDVQRKRK